MWQLKLNPPLFYINIVELLTFQFIIIHFFFASRRRDLWQFVDLNAGISNRNCDMSDPLIL